MASPVPDLPDDVFRHVFLSSPNALVLRDVTGRILAVNTAFEALFGLEMTDVLGADLCAVLHPIDAQTARPAPWSLSGAAFLRKTRWASRDGQAVDATVSQVPVGRADGQALFCLVFRDIASRRRAEKQVRAAERKYRSIFENAVEGIFQTTPQGRYLEVNRTLARIYGFETVPEMIRYFRDIRAQLYVDPGRRDDFIRELAAHDAVLNFESQIRKKSGEIIWISENARVVRDAAGGTPLYYEGTVVDITARKRAEAELATQRAYFSQLFANSPQAIALIDMHRNIVDANQGFEALFGYRAEELKGFGMREFIVPNDLMADCENVRNAILTGRSVQRETVRLHADGRRIPVSMIGFPIVTGGENQGIVYIYQDISERKAFEEQITHQAFHDALTGLPNRSLFADRLDRALTRAKRLGDARYAVLMIDLNKFKSVNDSLGHLAGDMLLQEVARRLLGCVRSMDTVARLGGDEFALILEELKAEQEVLAVADRIGAVLARPLALCGTSVSVGASIGIVLQTRDYDSADDILRDADIAMYRAKEQGRPSLVFDRRMHQELLDTISLEIELRQGLERGELLLHYQPIVSVHDGHLEGFEALVRWDHPIRGIVPPARFIPLAEETGLILPLGRFVISEACRQLRAWQQEMPEAAALSVSVNVSCRQFVKDGLVEHVAAVLAETGLDPLCLKLEITESVLMHDPQHTARELRRLKALGVKIAIDDFGTGYSSLSYLSQLPIDHLKIDRSFISGQDQTGEGEEIVKSIISLARSLGLTVVAEGVERADQLERLRLADCDKAQGFMFSRPVDRESAARLIRTQGC